MTLTCKFDIESDVKILAIDQPGIVRQVRWDSRGISYLVTYWWDADMKEVWISERELGPKK